MEHIPVNDDADGYCPAPFPPLKQVIVVLTQPRLTLSLESTTESSFSRLI